MNLAILALDPVWIGLCAWGGLPLAEEAYAWNIDGVTVRTGLGRVHHFSWREVVAVDRYSHRDGSGSFRVCGRGYALPGGKSGAEQFARYVNKRRKARGLRF